jgi:type IV secretory pathway protease TraF
VTNTPSKPSPPARPRITVRWRSFWRTLGAGLAAIVVLSLAGAALATRLTVNVTTSMPRGLYWLDPGRPIERGTVVCLPVPASVRPLVEARRYLPPNFRLLKRVVALPGDSVCLDDRRYVVDGTLRSVVADHDLLGRQLTPYHFCLETIMKERRVSIALSAIVLG